MDKLEQKLKNYYQFHEEYRPEAISDEFLERLKALESSPEAARKPRRRYVLPVAAVLALAVGIGGWTWAHLSRSGDVPAQDPGVTLEEPVSPAPEDPAIPSRPAAPEKKDPASPAPKAEAGQITEAPVSLTKPEQSFTAPPESGDPAPARPAETAPSPEGKPNTPPGGVAPVKPEDTAPEQPVEPAPEKPGSDTPAKPETDPPAKPDEGTTVKPEADPQPKPDEPDPAGTEDPDPPPVNPSEPHPPAMPQIPPEIGVVYLNEGGRETLTLTLLSTGEIEEIDVTGLYPLSPQTPTDLEPLDETPAQAAGENQTFIGGCSAFGWEIAYTLTRTDKDTVFAEAFAIRETDQTEKGESNET